jgi:hypothetical protein
VELGNFESAVEIWMKAERVLETQTHYESFIKIRDECKGIIEDIKVRVQAKMLAPETSAQDAISSAATLIKMGQPAAGVPDELAKTRARQAIMVLEQLPKPDDVFELLDVLEDGLVASLVLFVQGYTTYLLGYSVLLRNTGRAG